ncbi:hypothetical protein [Streptomyces sp. NPDC096193]|uniref:hypothetical protein n=1 Tax=Streptomyces sp. NPDC096193 TaxID=3155821 RepID=UPI00332FA76A
MAQRHPGALGLVLNAAVEELRALPAEERKHDVLDEDIARVSPLKHANLNTRPLQLHRLDPGRRRPAPASGP